MALFLTGISDLGQTLCFWAIHDEILLGGLQGGEASAQLCLPAWGATIKDAKS